MKVLLAGAAVVVVGLISAASFYGGVTYARKGTTIGAAQMPLPGIVKNPDGSAPPPALVPSFGTVTAKTTTSITLTLSTGGTQTFSVSTTTKYASQPAQLSLKDIPVGSSVAVAGTPAGLEQVVLVPQASTNKTQ